MINKIYKTVLLFIIPLMFSCEMVVNVEIPDHIPLIVANCFFSSDSTWKVSVSHSLSILDNGDIKVLNNATVLIMINNQVVSTLTFNDSINGGCFTSLDKPESGKNYTLSVSAPNYQSVTSENSIPNKVEIDTITYLTTLVKTEFSDNSREITINFTDLPNIKNYYQLKIFKDDSIFGETAVSFFTRDVSLSDEYYWGNDAHFNDFYFDGKKKSLILYIDNSKSVSGKFRFILVTANDSYYLYNTTAIKNINNSNNPFSEPVIVYNNINNGYGIFAGYNSDEFILEIN